MKKYNYEPAWRRLKRRIRHRRKLYGRNPEDLEWAQEEMDRICRELKIPVIKY